MAKPKDDDGTQAVAPSDFHRSEGQTDLEKSQIGFVERNRLNYFKIPFAPAAVDDLTEKLTVDFGFQNQRLFFLLSDTAPVGMGNNIQIAIEKRDKLTVRLAAEILDLTLHSDLFLEVENIVGVGVDRDDPGKLRAPTATPKALPFQNSLSLTPGGGSPVFSSAFSVGSRQRFPHA